MYKGQMYKCTKKEKSLQCNEPQKLNTKLLGSPQDKDYFIFYGFISFQCLFNYIPAFTIVVFYTTKAAFFLQFLYIIIDAIARQA